MNVADIGRQADAGAMATGKTDDKMTRFMASYTSRWHRTLGEPDFRGPPPRLLGIRRLLAQTAFEKPRSSLLIITASGAPRKPPTVSSALRVKPRPESTRQPPGRPVCNTPAPLTDPENSPLTAPDPQDCRRPRSQPPHVRQIHSFAKPDWQEPLYPPIDGTEEQLHKETVKEK